MDTLNSGYNQIIPIVFSNPLFERQLLGLDLQG